MQLIIGDLWDELGKADLLLFPANNVIDKAGRLVMGAGVAKQFKMRFPELPAKMGHRLRDCTNYYGVVTVSWPLPRNYSLRIGAFQTKYHWRDPSPLELIKRSTEKLVFGANQFGRIAMPMPGCGHGGLNESDVLPILKALPDNVFVYKLPDERASATVTA